MEKQKKIFKDIQKYISGIKILNKTIIGTFVVEFLGILALLTTAAFFPSAAIALFWLVVGVGPVVLLGQLVAQVALRSFGKEKIEELEKMDAVTNLQSDNDFSNSNSNRKNVNQPTPDKSNDQKSEFTISISELEKLKSMLLNASVALDQEDQAIKKGR